MQNDGRNPEPSKSSEELHAAAVARHRQLPMMPQDILDALLASSAASGVIVITDANGNKVAPAFQLDTMLRLRRSVFYVNTTSVASSHPHDILDWWLQPNSHLDDRSPRNLLGTAEERLVMDLADLMNLTEGTTTAIHEERYDQYMMHPSVAEKEAIRKERRRLQLARQMQLLAQIETLSIDDTVKVLKDAPEHIIVLLDPHSAAIRIPAFQFTRNNHGELVPNPKIQEVHCAKGGNIGFPNLNVNGAWDLIDWWFNNHMKFDASNQDEQKFVPISLVDDDAKLDLLINWIKGWANEVSYG